MGTGIVFQLLFQGLAHTRWLCEYNRHFWAEGYYISTVGLNEATVKKYIAEQEIHGKMSDKISIKEYEDPFKGGK